MTTTPIEESPTPLVRPFPPVGRLLNLAYRELQLAEHGTQEQRDILGDPALLPRPWNPSTCHATPLRQELWAWLDHVVTWLNHEHVWDTDAMIPSCWPYHPHLVHELAVLADQRRTADTAFSCDALEDWHRYSLPYFTERMRNHTKTHCEDGHQPWPAKGRHNRHTAQHTVSDRMNAFHDDITSQSRIVSNSGV